jgi:diguanylate cyclase (GGDEF)-like protein/PAS domain S-box-containing protein
VSDHGSIIAPDLRRVVDSSRAAIVVVDLNGTVTFASAAVQSLMGVDPQMAVGESVLSWLHPDDVERAIVSLAANDSARKMRYFPMVFRLRHVDGRFIEADLLVTNMLEDPDVRGIALDIRAAEDRTQYIDPVRALAAGADHATVLRLIASGVGRGGHSLRPAFIAAARDEVGRFREVHAVRASDELAMLVADFLDGAGGDALGDMRSGELRSIPATELPGRFRAWCSAGGYAGLRVGGIDAQHQLVALLVSVEAEAVWHDGAWTPSTNDHWRQLLELATVAFERHRFQSRLLHAATHDSLTNLANRAHFFERLARYAGRSSVAVLYVDLDEFKRINDLHGHLAGDAVLGEVAVRLRAAVRPGDLVGRLGGDEFAVAVADADAALVAELSRRIADEVARPLPEHIGPARVTASVGTALVGRGEDIDQLVHHADEALLEAKRRRRSAVVAGART